MSLKRRLTEEMESFLGPFEKNEALKMRKWLVAYIEQVCGNRPEWLKKRNEAITEGVKNTNKARFLIERAVPDGETWSVTGYDELKKFLTTSKGSPAISWLYKQFYEGGGELIYSDYRIEKLTRESK